MYPQPRVLNLQPAQGPHGTCSSSPLAGSDPWAPVRLESTCKTGQQPSLHLRGCRVDVFAHPLAVRLGALAPRLGLACFHCAFWGLLLELRLLPLLGDLSGSRATAGLEPLKLGKFPSSPAHLVAEAPSPARQPPHRGPQTQWWSRCGSPPSSGGRQMRGAGRRQRAPPSPPA